MALEPVGRFEAPRQSLRMDVGRLVELEPVGKIEK